MGHEKAAHEIYTGLFAPETAMETPVGRVCLHWYARFDGFISFRASFPSGLPPEYIDNMAAYYKSQLELRPDDITMLAADRTTSLRKIAMSQAFLFARRNRGQISQEEFVKEHHRHTQMLRHYRENWHPLLTDPQYLVTDFGGRTPDPEDIVNPYQPGLLYRPPLFVTTVASAEWHSLMVMHLIHLLPLDPASVYPEIMKHVFAVCNYFSAAQKWPETPKGFMLQLTAVVQVSGPFLPKDEKHNMWTRRQSAYSEQIG